MRSFVWLGLCSLVSIACRGENDFRVVPAPPELVEIGLGDRGDRLIFFLPDADWRRIDEEPFRGFLYGKEERTLRVVIVLKEDRFADAVDEARRASGAEIRDFDAGRSWSFVGVVVSYRGPPDAAMLAAFVRSFKVERR